METRAHHVLVGLFTIAAITGALLFALWLGKSSVDREFKLYEIVFNEAVTGLSIGSTVQYNGIKVGDVSDLQLDPKDPRQVQVLIRVGGNTPVKQDTHARLALTGLTGTAIIQLYGGSPQSPELHTTDDKPATIVADPSPLARLLADGGDLLSNINQLLLNANHMFSNQNIERVSNTLDHLEQTTQVLAGEQGNIRQLIVQLASASTQANQTFTETSRLLSTTNALLAEQGEQILIDAQKSMASLEQSTAQLEQFFDENSQTLNSGLKGLAETGPTLAELRTTLASLRQVIRQFHENPSALLLEREQRQEFRP